MDQLRIVPTIASRPEQVRVAVYGPDGLVAKVEISAVLAAPIGAEIVSLAAQAMRRTVVVGENPAMPAGGHALYCVSPPAHHKP